MLESPVFITDARERWAFAALDAGGAAGPADGRPYFDAAFFWGPLWRARARDSVNVRTIRPEQADQQARIYLARRMSEAPLLVYRKGAPDARITRRVSPDGVRVL